MVFPDIKLKGKQEEMLTGIRDDWNVLAKFVGGISRELEEGELEWVQSRARVALGCLIDRLLLLASGSILSLGDDNLPSSFSSTRSAMEVSANVAYLLYILELKIPLEERIEMMNNVFLQTRGTSRPRSKAVTKDISIMTVIDIADGFWKSVSKEAGWKGEPIGFRVEYETLCNFDHPNFDSHLSVGSFKEENGKVTWHAHTEGEITEAMSAHVLMPLILTLGMARMSSSRIVRVIDNLASDK